MPFSFLRASRRLRCPTVVLLGIAFILGACAGTSETEERSEQTPAAPRAEQAGPNLAPTSDAVRTIQFYAGRDEQRLPVLPLGGGHTLTLAFDLMQSSGRPLSIYFYHADRSWRRDLIPGEYMTAFQDDTLLDYTPSRGTDLRYAHYTYRFPNSSIDFELSGNYVVRVTEQGREDEVLFERAFYVTEQAGPLEVSVDEVMVSGQERPSERPVARFRAAATGGGAFDYTVCFVRNGQFDQPRCTRRPRLVEQPNLIFELERERAFAPAPATYTLDLSTLRVGGQIEGVDFQQSPPHVLLDPDFARFPGGGLALNLSGQSLVRAAVREVEAPEVEAEYIRVRFSYVPPGERPLGRDVFLTGSFSPAPDGRVTRMQWVPERGRYEAEALVKQGQYAYRYEVEGGRLQEIVERALPAESHYTTFVYYRDESRGTDRLLAVQDQSGDRRFR